MLAARALAYMGPSAAAAAPALIRAATDSSDQFAGKCVEALVNMGAAIQASLPVLIEQLNSGSPSVRERTLKIIARVAPYAGSIADIVQSCAGDADPAAREAARVAIDQIQKAQLSGMSR
jgi:HEAT repeat protein